MHGSPLTGLLANGLPVWRDPRVSPAEDAPAAPLGPGLGPHSPCSQEGGWPSCWGRRVDLLKLVPYGALAASRNRRAACHRWESGVKLNFSVKRNIFHFSTSPCKRLLLGGAIFSRPPLGLKLSSPCSAVDRLLEAPCSPQSQPLTTAVLPGCPQPGLATEESRGISFRGPPSTKQGFCRAQEDGGGSSSVPVGFPFQEQEARVW